MHNPLFVHTSALTWICVPSPCRSRSHEKKEILRQYFQCVTDSKKKRKKKRRRQLQKEKRSKVCGASSNSNTICINVHNRHDFYFIVSPSSQITSIITKQKEKKQAKYLTTVTITNKLSSLRLCCGLLRCCRICQPAVALSPRRCCLHEKNYLWIM